MQKYQPLILLYSGAAKNNLPYINSATSQTLSRSYKYIYILQLLSTKIKLYYLQSTKKKIHLPVLAEMKLKQRLKEINKK